MFRKSPVHRYGLHSRIIKSRALETNQRSLRLGRAYILTNGDPASRETAICWGLIPMSSRLDGFFARR